MSAPDPTPTGTSGVQRLTVNLDDRAQVAIRRLSESAAARTQDITRRALLRVRLDPNATTDLFLRVRDGHFEVIDMPGDRPTNPDAVEASADKEVDAALGQPQTVILPEAGILGPDGRPLADDEPQTRHMLLDVREVSAEVLAALARKPADLHTVTPRRFEEIVAELLARRGYEVTLTPSSRDRGRDLLVAVNGALGSFLCLVECKRWAPTRPVTVDVVRQLYGVVTASKATAGVVATTSRFTKDSKDFQAEVRYQMTLRDFEDLARWLRAYR